MKKKILSTLSAVLTFVMLLGAFAVIPVGAEEQSASKPTVETEFGWNGYTARAPKGKGTIDEPYEISSPENLLWMKNLSSNGAQHFRTFGENHEVWIPTYAEEDNLDTESAKTVDYTSFESAPQVYFKQTCDIDLNGKTLTSIASYWIATGATNGTKYAKGQWFGGHYDGQGYAIKNGYIKGSGTNANWNGGLFGAVWGATIENMVFDNVHSYGSEDVSMVVGKVLGPKDFDTTGATADIFNARETVIQNITVKDNCTIKQEGQSNETGLYAGGIVARANANATIRNCINKADITVDANVGFVGGILGVLGSNSTVDHCVNEGDIYFTGLWKTSADAEAQTGVFKGECAFGGIVGSWNYISGTDIFGDMAITNCINKGSFESAAVTGGTMMSYGGISGRTVALATANGATYTFKNNINMGADPCDNINTNVTGSSKNRAAALIGSAWNAETYEWAQLVATNCYSAPFTGIGTGYPLRPSDDNPLVCSADKKTPTIASRPCATADSTCETLGSVNEVLGLGLYVQINFEIDGFDHKFLAAQYKDQADGTYSVRLISGIDSVEYKKLSYDVVLTVDGKQASKSYVQYAVYTSVLADGYDGATTRNASEFGYEYLSLLTFNGLKADVTYSIGFTPKVVYLDGTMSEGKPVILNICNGEVTYEDPNATATGDIKIAGNDIGSYTITYDASNEPTYYVANAIKNYIAQATGKTLTLADVNSASGEYIINVGNAAEKGTYSVTQTGKRLDLLFSGAVAAEELVEQIKNLYMNNRDYNVDLCTVDGKLYVEQNHKVLGDIEAAAEVKAVFEKDSDSDIRIMYQNIHGLSMMSEAETQGYTGTKDELTQKVLELLQAAYV